MNTPRHTSRHPDSSLDYPNSKYGYGEIDAYNGLLHILGAARIEGVSHHQPQLLRISASDGLLQLTCDTPPTAPLHVSIYSLGGTLVHDATIHTPLASCQIPLTSCGVRSGLASSHRAMTPATTGVAIDVPVLAFQA